MDYSTDLFRAPKAPPLKGPYADVEEYEPLYMDVPLSPSAEKYQAMLGNLTKISEFDGDNSVIDELIKKKYGELTVTVATMVKNKANPAVINNFIESQKEFDAIDLADMHSIFMKNHTMAGVFGKAVGTLFFGLQGHIASGYVSKIAMDAMLYGKSDIEKSAILAGEKAKLVSDTAKRDGGVVDTIDAFAEGYLGAQMGVSDVFRQYSEADVALSNWKNFETEVEQSPEYTKYKEMGSDKDTLDDIKGFLIEGKYKKRQQQFFDDSQSVHSMKIKSDELEERLEDDNMPDRLDKRMTTIATEMVKNNPDITYEEARETIKETWVAQWLNSDNWDKTVPAYNSKMERSASVGGNIANLLVSFFGVTKLAGTAKTAIGSTFGHSPTVANLSRFGSHFAGDAVTSAVRMLPAVPMWVYGYAGHSGAKEFDKLSGEGKATNVAMLGATSEALKTGGTAYMMYGVLAPLLGPYIFSNKLGHVIGQSTKLGKTTQALGNAIKYSTRGKVTGTQLSTIGQKALVGSALTGSEQIGLNLLNEDAVWSDDIAFATGIGFVMASVGMMNDDYRHGSAKLYSLTKGAPKDSYIVRALEEGRHGEVTDLIQEIDKFERSGAFLTSQYSKVAKFAGDDVLASKIKILGENYFTSLHNPLTPQKQKLAVLRTTVDYEEGIRDLILKLDDVAPEIRKQLENSITKKNLNISIAESNLLSQESAIFNTEFIKSSGFANLPSLRNGVKNRANDLRAGMDIVDVYRTNSTKEINDILFGSKVTDVVDTIIKGVK